MFIFGYFFIALAKVLDVVLPLYMYIVIARAVLSWVNPDPYNPIVRFIHNITEPLFLRVREKLPVTSGGIDFTPFVIILIIIFLREFFVRGFYRCGSNLL